MRTGRNTGAGTGSEEGTRTDVETYMTRQAASKSGTLGAALAGLNDPGVRSKILGDGLPDLENIEVPVMSEEDQTRAAEEAKKRRQFAEGAGKKLATVNRQIAVLKADPEDLEFSPTKQAQLKNLKATRAKLLVEDEAVRKHTEFVAFMEEVRQARPEEAMAYVRRAAETGRIRTTTRTAGANLLILGKTVYEPAPDSAGKVTPATLGLMAELRKLCQKGREALNERRKDEVVAMREEATEGLTLTRIITEKAQSGKIYCFLPPREIKNPDGTTRWLRSSHTLWECDGRLIRPLRAIGGLDRRFAELISCDAFVTVESVRAGRLILDRRLPDEPFKTLLGLLNITKAVLAQEAARATAVIAKPTEAEAETNADPKAGKTPRRAKKS